MVFWDKKLNKFITYAPFLSVILDAIFEHHQFHRNTIYSGYLLIAIAVILMRDLIWQKKLSGIYISLVFILVFGSIGISSKKNTVIILVHINVS